MLNYKLFAVFAVVLASGIFFDNAFADHTTTQPNANVSYDSTTKEVQVEWDFTTGPNAPTTCLLKGDFWFMTDLDNAWGTSQSDSNNVAHTYYDHVTYITGFTPIHYSVVSSNPSVVQTISEEIPCQGSTRVDIDTVMSHSSNVKLDGVTPREDLQIFFSFYSLHEGKSYLFDLIDEVFVFYTPNDTWSTAAQDYACAGQAGNTIYIDQSAKGIHTNSGADCDVYLELDSNQWIDIADDKSQTPGTHDAGVFSLLIKVVEQITALLTSSGGDDDHNSKPTFGFDHKTFVKRVDNGLVINDEVYTVTDNYWTPMPMLYLEVGATQNFTATVFSPNPLKIMEFAFGIPEVGEWHKSEASIVIETNYDGKVLSSEITKDTYPPILNATSLESSVSKVKCVADDKTEPCYQVSIEFSFMEAPLGNVFGVQAIDEKRKNQILYFNDGITLDGDSQNPPVIKQIISEIKYKGLQTVQRIDKENNIWQSMDKSEPVLLYKQNDHGSFNPIEYRVFEKTPDTLTTNIDRLHSEFTKSIKFEQKRAVQYFDSTLYLGQLPDSWSHHWKETDRMTEIIDDIEAETKRTQEVYENTYPDYEKAKSNFKE